MTENEWLDYAEEDEKLAEVALRANIFGGTCFHCQQAVEKFLKAYIFAKQRNVPKIHSLGELLDICEKYDKNFAIWRKKCKSIDQYYILPRYPVRLFATKEKRKITKKDATEALKIVREIKSFIMKRIKK